MLVGGGRLAAALIALVTMRAVTALLTPEQYGELALLIAIQTFCGSFLINPIGQHINLHTHAWWDDGTLMAKLKSYSHYVLFVSLLGGIVELVMTKQHTMSQIACTAIAVFAMVTAATWNSTLVFLLNMLGFRAASVFCSVLTATVSLATSIALVLLQPSATSWFAGQTLGLAAGALIAKRVLQQRAVKAKFIRGILPLIDKRTIVRYCLPLSLATGLMWLQLSGYRFVVDNYWGLAQLGFIAVGLQLAGQIWALAESLAMQFLYPMFFRRVSSHEDESEVKQAFSDLLNTLVPVYFVITGMMIVSAPYLLEVLVAPRFRDVAEFIMLGTLIELCRVLGNLLSIAAHVKRETLKLSLPYAVGATTILTLVYFAGIEHREIGWVGMALSVGSMMMLVTMWVIMQRQVVFKVDLNRWLWGVAAMLGQSATTIWMPKASGSGMSVLILTGAGVIAASISLTLLWKNPATQRLLNVNLRNT